MHGQILTAFERCLQAYCPAFCEANGPVVVVSGAGDLPARLLVALDLNIVDVLSWVARHLPRQHIAQY